MEAVLQDVERVARTDASVVIVGETGTGKESIARRIHELSRRQSSPLVCVNAGAMPAGIVESDLFGHEKGAFTGAINRRPGYFEQANGGTLFLDEVSETPMDVQAKLLRVIQEKEFIRVGGTCSETIDVRMISATNGSLEEAVQAGSFRQDLYYRLHVVPIVLPPLRERKEDIPLLVDHFLKFHGDAIGFEDCQICPRTLDRLIQHDWPGNVRELSNIIERGLALSDESIFRLEEPIPSPTPRSEDNLLLLCDVERSHILRVLDSTRWVINGPQGAARILGLHPNTLRNRMNKLRIFRKVSLAAA